MLAFIHASTASSARKIYAAFLMAMFLSIENRRCRNQSFRRHRALYLKKRIPVEGCSTQTLGSIQKVDPTLGSVIL